MERFTKPSSLNAIQLKSELLNAGIEVDSITDFGDETIGFSVSNKESALKIVAAHKGVDTIKELTIDEKLSSVGLSLADLKEALGL